MTLKFTDVYLSNNFNPCPCGYFYTDDDLLVLKEHFEKGHYSENINEKEKT